MSANRTDKLIMDVDNEILRNSKNKYILSLCITLTNIISTEKRQITEGKVQYVTIYTKVLNRKYSKKHLMISTYVVKV